MAKNKKAAGRPHAQATQQNICGLDSTQIIVRLKAAYFRIAAWLSMVVGGSLC